MSAPQTDPEKQLRHHLIPILAILLIVVVVIFGFFWWIGDEASDPEMPGDVPAENIQPSQP